MLVARGVGVALLAGVGVLLTARPAKACDCAGGPEGSLRWPRDGAMDVAVDTPIVIERYYLEGDLDDITFELSDENGEAVALEEMRRHDPVWAGCSQGQYLFLRPAEPLVEGATYMLTIVADAEPQVASFTVGEHELEPQAAIDLDPLYLSVHGQMACDSEEWCGIGEVHVDLGGAPEMPLWLVVKSAAIADGVDDTMFWPLYAFDGRSVPESAWTRDVSVVLPADDPCIDVELLGVEGRTLFHERRCEPDRCAIYDVVGQDSCGGPPFSPVEATHLRPGSCDDPPELHSQPGVGVVYPDAGTATGAEVEILDAGTAGDAAVEVRRGTGLPLDDASVLLPGGRTSVQAERPMQLEEDGCSVSGPRSAGAASPWPLAFALALALCIAVRARRRVG